VKTVVQRVRRAAVTVDAEVVGAIGHGIMALVGVEKGDTEADAEVTARKLANLRMFRGETPMDRTLADVGGAALVVSQFTLAGSIRKGRRPSFNDAAEPERATSLYEHVCAMLRAEGIEVATGCFGAMMEVELVGDGPVTLLVFTRDGALL
jgi:D-tyrosyl-tRNA(Tyr) deacylase